jgi:hypothetical protein
MTAMSLTLLIAEPSPALQSALARYFLTQGFDVRTADTGLALVRELERELPQVVLLEPEILCGCDSGGAPFVPTVVLTRLPETAPALPENFVVRRRFDKPARLAQVRESLRAAAAAGPHTGL